MRTKETGGQSHGVLEAMRRRIDQVFIQWIKFLYEFNKVSYRTPSVRINHLEVYLEKEML